MAISKKDLKEYEFESMWDYYAYILESKTNGNYSQVNKLIKEMSLPQRFDFLDDIVWNFDLPKSEIKHWVSTVKRISC